MSKPHSPLTPLESTLSRAEQKLGQRRGSFLSYEIQDIVDLYMQVKLNEGTLQQGTIHSHMDTLGHALRRMMHPERRAEANELRDTIRSGDLEKISTALTKIVEDHLPDRGQCRKDRPRAASTRISDGKARSARDHSCYRG